MTIELFGLPASGKTTLAKELHNLYGYQVIKTNNKIRLIAYVFLFSFFHIRLLFANLWLIFKYSGSYHLWRYKMINCLMQNSYKQMVGTRVQKSVIDQGLWQNILSLFEKPVSSTRLEKYIKLLPNTHNIIVFDVSKDIWEERIKNRGYFARTKFDQRTVESWKQVMFDNFQLTKKIMNDLNIPHVLLDATKPLSAQVEKMKNIKV